MALIALEGLALVLVVYAPLVLYIFWSWNVLRQQRSAVTGNSTWLRRAGVPIRFLIGAATASIFWLILARAAGPFAILLTYNLAGEKLAIAQFSVILALLPLSISGSIAGLLADATSYSENADLYWLLACGTVTAVLLAVSFMKWLFLRHVRTSER